MTVVRFPTTVRLTVTRGEDCERLVSATVDAADAALSRAVRHAAQLHLVRDARYQPDRRPSIDVTFTGDELPAGAAARLRAELAGLAAARAVELLARPNRDRAGRELAANEVAGDRFDDAMLLIDPRAAVDDAYLIPSYGSGGTKVAVPVSGKGTASTPTPPPPHLRLMNIDTPDEMQVQIIRRFGASPPPVLVAIFRERGIPVSYLFRVEPTGQIRAASPMGQLARYDAPTGEGAGRWHATSVYGVDAIEFDREVTTAADRRAMREELWVEALRIAAGQAHITEANLRRQAAEIVRPMPDPGGTSSYYWFLSHGNRVQRMEVDRAHLFQGRLPVAVFTEMVSDTTGTDGGTGTGDDTTDPPLPLQDLLIFDPDIAHPFLAEPPVEFWPPGISAYLTDQIADIAAKLDMPVGRFPGMYAIAAVAKIDKVARLLGPGKGSGQQGDSPRMTELRRMIAAVGSIEQMQRYYVRIIAGAAEGHTLRPPLRHNSGSWMLHFHEEYVPRRNKAVGTIFGATCQDILLDMMESSRFQLLARKSNFKAYMAITRALILLMLVDEPELTALRALLAEETPSKTTTVVVAAAGGAAIGTWFDATRLLTTALGHVESATDGPPRRGRIRHTQDGPQVQDSVGRWWTRVDLDSVLSGTRQQVFAIDPMLEKIADLPDTVERLRFAGAAGIDAEFESVLDEILKENDSKTTDISFDFDIAFGLATFEEAKVTDKASLGAELSGIHAQADAVLRPLFVGESEYAYVTGMRALVASELGKASLLEFFNLVGLTAIAILCPPLAFAIGAVEAVAGVETALEHRGIQRAMLGGDAILSKAQAEAELWGAAIGAALVFIPELPGLARGASSAIGSAVRTEAREAATVAGEQVVKQAVKHLAEVAAEDLLKVFVTECVKGYLLNLAIGGAIGRFTQAIAREVAVTGNVSMADLSRVIGDAISGPAEQP